MRFRYAHRVHGSQSLSWLLPLSGGEPCAVQFHAREIEAHAEPMKGGYFLKCDHPAAAGIGKGDEIEVNAAKLEVQYVIAFPGGEPEVWMLTAPKKAGPALPF